jgi:crotonobetainyl-CoA hydratase
MVDVELRRDGHVAVVRLNRPHALNALTVDADRELLDAWSEVNENPEIRVAVLCAAGDRAFCAGADVGDLDARARTRIAVGGGLTGLGGPRLRLRKPLVAAVHGHVLGSGFELALCADLIVAADGVRFGIPEGRLGVLGEAGVLHRVVRAVPHRVAMAMILAGETLDAQQALALGLVNEVVAFADLDAAAMRWAGRVLEASPLVVQAAKVAVEDRLGWPLDVALTTRYEPIEALAFTRDRQEATDAFRERRAPEWEGR